MSPVSSSPAERLLAVLPGWIAFLTGVGLWAATMLLPAYQVNQELAWQRDVLQAKAQHVQMIRQRFALYREALEAGDELALQQSAYLYFNLIPEGRHIHNPQQEMTDSPASTWNHSTTVPYSPVSNASVAAILNEPLPRVGAELPEYVPANTRLIRLATGDYRLFVMAASGIFLVAGLWLGIPEEQRRLSGLKRHPKYA